MAPLETSQSSSRPPFSTSMIMGGRVVWTCAHLQIKGILGVSLLVHDPPETLILDSLNKFCKTAHLVEQHPRGQEVEIMNILQIIAGWPSKNRGGPPNHPFVHRVFHYKPSILGCFPPIFGNTHIATKGPDGLDFFFFPFGLVTLSNFSARGELWNFRVGDAFSALISGWRVVSY